MHGWYSLLMSGAGSDVELNCIGSWSLPYIDIHALCKLSCYIFSLTRLKKVERKYSNKGGWRIGNRCRMLFQFWAASSEFVSSSIPSWQILTAHAQPFRGARDLAFCLKVPLDSLLVWASSGGSGETVRMRRLAWTFAARIGDKYQIRLMRPTWSWQFYYISACSLTSIELSIVVNTSSMKKNILFEMGTLQFRDIKQWNRVE